MKFDNFKPRNFVSALSNPKICVHGFEEIGVSVFHFPENRYAIRVTISLSVPYMVGRFLAELIFFRHHFSLFLQYFVLTKELV